MHDRAGYGQFCPVSMATEVLCARWTPLVLRELLCGTTRFNDLRRGVPRMSPSLLSKRLKDLERAGILCTVPGDHGMAEYRLTEAGEDLRPFVMEMGRWGQRWIESRLTLKNLDPSLLMWDMRRNLNPVPLPPRRCTVQFLYPDLAPASRAWWLVVDKAGVDLCRVDPGYELDVLVTGSLRAVTSVWMGITTLSHETASGALVVTGDAGMVRTMRQWLGLSPFAGERRRVA